MFSLCSWIHNNHHLKWHANISNGGKFPSVCLSVRSSACHSVFPSVCPSLWPSVCSSVCPSQYLSVRLSVRLFFCSSVCPSDDFSVCSPVRASVNLSVCLSVRPSVCLSWSLSFYTSVSGVVDCYQRWENNGWRLVSDRVKMCMLSLLTLKTLVESGLQFVLLTLQTALQPLYYSTNTLKLFLYFSTVCHQKRSRPCCLWFFTEKNEIQLPKGLL